MINKQIKFKPTFDKIKQFEQLLFQFPVDTGETIASNCHWVHRKQSITNALDSFIGKYKHDVKP